LPASPDQSILALNPQLADLATLNVLKWASPGADREPSIGRVFPEAHLPDRHRLVHYVVLVGWVDGPMATYESIRERMQKAQEASGLDEVLRESVVRGRPPFSGITKGDVLFAHDSNGLKYLLAFLQYQQNIMWERLQRMQLLENKMWDEIYAYPLKESEDPGKLLTAWTAYNVKYIENSIRYSELHADIMRSNSTVNRLLEQVQSGRKVENSQVATQEHEAAAQREGMMDE
jgi:hypothetical protein